MAELSPDLLDILICVACRAKVAQEDDAIVCLGCGLVYPIEDGIPIMLLARATRKAEDTNV